MTASIDDAGGYRFRPALAQTLAVVVLLPVLVALGIWQLYRAEQKAGLLAMEEAARESSPVPVSILSTSSTLRHAVAQGRYDRNLFLLDNRVKAGQAGYELLAPLRMADGRGVLINLGWLPPGTTRKQLPAVSPPQGTVQVTGLAITPEPPPFTLSQREAMTAGWPKVVQTAEPKRLAPALNYPLLPVLLYPDGSEVAQRRLATMEHFGPSRHRAYALQWFAMALVLLGIYLRHGFQRGK